MTPPPKKIFFHGENWDFLLHAYSYWLGRKSDAKSFLFYVQDKTNSGLPQTQNTGLYVVSSKWYWQQTIWRFLAKAIFPRKLCLEYNRKNKATTSGSQSSLKWQC